MIWLVLLLFAAGLALSGLFSGSETGFYRVTRLRLLLDALAGDRRAWWLLWSANRPLVFISTTLVGNNLANYMLSLSIVLGVQTLYGQEAVAGELAATFLLTPLIFVYGELLPKNISYHAPYRLLRLATPALMVCAVLLAPLTLVVFAVSKLLERVVGQRGSPVQLRLAQTELTQILEEGQAAGILHPAQRALAQGLFAVANLPVRDFVLPVSRVARGLVEMSRDELLRIAARAQSPWVVLEEAFPRRHPVGYVRVDELRLQPPPHTPPIRPLIEIPDSETHLGALVRLRAADEPVARVVDEGGRILGLVTLEQLAAPLFRTGV